MSRTGDAGFPTSAAILLGIGLGGSFDGIVLRELLHSRALMGAGWLQAAMWLLMVVALAMLWRRASRPHARWSTRALVGALLLGFGAFNLTAGLLYYRDLALLASGALLVAAGWFLRRTRRAAAAQPIVERRKRPMRWRPGDRRAAPL